MSFDDRIISHTYAKPYNNSLIAPSMHLHFEHSEIFDAKHLNANER